MHFIFEDLCKGFKVKVRAAMPSTYHVGMGLGAGWLISGLF